MSKNDPAHKYSLKIKYQEFEASKNSNMVAKTILNQKTFLRADVENLFSSFFQKLSASRHSFSSVENFQLEKILPIEW